MLGMMFAQEEPPGWYIGTILTEPVPRSRGQTENFWVNFTYDFNAKAEMDKDNDVKVHANSLDISTYQEEWVMICRKESLEELSETSGMIITHTHNM